MGERFACPGDGELHGPPCYRLASEQLNVELIAPVVGDESIITRNRVPSHGSLSRRRPLRSQAGDGRVGSAGWQPLHGSKVGAAELRLDERRIACQDDPRRGRREVALYAPVNLAGCERV